MNTSWTQGLHPASSRGSHTSLVELQTHRKSEAEQQSSRIDSGYISYLNVIGLSFESELNRWHGKKPVGPMSAIVLQRTVPDPSFPGLSTLSISSLSKIKPLSI